MDNRHEILRVTVGSHMWGTATRESDIDQRAVVMSPLRNVLSPFVDIKPARQYEEPDFATHATIDSTAYELSHFVRLLTKGNPTLIETVFSPYVEWFNVIGERLLELREHCLDSHAIYQAHRGFAVGQFKEAQKEQPSRPKGKLLSAGFLGLLQANELLRYKTVNPARLLNGEQWASRDYHIALKQGDEGAIRMMMAQFPDFIAQLDRVYELFCGEQHGKDGGFRPNYDLITDFIVEAYTGATSFHRTRARHLSAQGAPA